MSNLSQFCTCTDTACPLHPSNHEKGCVPCIAKNLQAREIPSCFFKKLNLAKKPDSYYFEDFARAVLESNEKNEG